IEVLVEQLDQRAPVERLLHGQLVGVEKQAIGSAAPQLLAHPPHHVNVWVVVELDRGTEVEILPAALGAQAVEVASDLGLSRGRKREQQQYFDRLGHGGTGSWVGLSVGAARAPGSGFPKESGI